jgi:hypothetical protein
MNASLAQGLQLGGGAVQGKDVDKFFTRDATTGKLKPILQPLSTPVRAVVLPLLDLSLAQSLKKALTQHLVPLFPPDTVWLQNSELLHSTVYHASTHMVSSFNTSGEIFSKNILKPARQSSRVLKIILSTPFLILMLPL